MTGSGAGADGRAERASSLPTPFVGRQPELQALLAAWRQASERERQAVFVAGEPGIGKSRLVWELVRRVDRDGALSLLGRCDADRLVPYQPFIEALGGLNAACPTDALRRHLGDLPTAELARLVPDLPYSSSTMLPDDPRAERHRLFTAVTTLFARAASVNPMVLVLEDLHWADLPTLRLLRYMLRSPADAGLMLLVTYRETELEAGDPLSELLADLHRDEGLVRIGLGGLSEEAVSRLARAVSGQPVSADQARELHRATAGNPFFVRELAGLSDAQAVPDSVKDAITGRLDGLDRATVELLTVAAAVGREFSLGVIERASGLRGMATADAVDQACAAGLIEEVDPRAGICTFAHAIVRSGVYERLEEAERAALHLRIAEAIAPDDEHLAELSHHYLLAGDERGAVYAVRAGRQAFGQLAYEAAAEHWERALAVLGPARERDGLELLLALADAHWRAGEFERARERHHEAAELAQELDLPELLAAAALGFGGSVGARAGIRDERLIALLERALASLPGGDGPLRARVLARLAEALTFTDQRERIPELCEQAAAMARRVGDPGVLAAVLINVHWSRWEPGNARQRLAMAEEIVELAQQAGDAAREVDGRMWFAVDLIELGETSRADEELERCSPIAQRVRQRYQLWWLACLLALRALMAGRLAEADELATRALGIGQRDRNPNALQIYGVQLAGLRREQGRYGELEEGLKAFIDQYPAIRTWRCALAFLYADAGRARDALGELDALATDDFRGLPRDLFWLADLALLGQAAALAGSSGHAGLLYELLSPYARQNVVVGIAACWGSTSRVLALLAGALGRFEEAAGHFEDAIEQNAAIDAPAWRARCEVEYAGLLRRLGDSARADAFLRSARQTAEQLGLTDIARRADER
jgi:tetratricopeptide (TPR) repeat protein